LKAKDDMECPLL